MILKIFFVKLGPNTVEKSQKVTIPTKSQIMMISKFYRCSCCTAAMNILYEDKLFLVTFFKKSSKINASTNSRSF